MLAMFVLGALVSYMLGNLNGAVCISALLHDDVRSHGSGNAGLTNFIRNYGRGQALYVVAIDAGKAILSCLVSGCLLAPYGLYTEGAVLGGLFVMLGHIYPALLGFRGGKGILSGLFIALIADWRIGLIILAVFATVYFVTRYVSLASVMAAFAFSAAFVVLHWGQWTVAVCAVLMGGLTIFMHRGNIGRLLKGTEVKTDLFKKERSQ